MNSNDLVFLDEYKKIDNICRDLYNSKNGVSSYINDMQLKSNEAENIVPMWNNSIKDLKHLRWLRNKIAHEENELGFSSDDDLKLLFLYSKKFEKKEDPISALSKINGNKSNSHKDYIDANSSKKLFIFLIIFIAVILLIYFLKK